jgi:hypothetical protein
MKATKLHPKTHRCRDTSGIFNLASPIPLHSIQMTRIGKSAQFWLLLKL